MQGQNSCQNSNLNVMIAHKTLHKTYTTRDNNINSMNQTHDDDRT